MKWDNYIYKKYMKWDNYLNILLKEKLKHDVHQNLDNCEKYYFIILYEYFKLKLYSAIHFNRIKCLISYICLIFR
jgi:hypothetical protein